MRLPLPISVLTLTAASLFASACTSTTPQAETKVIAESKAAEQPTEFAVVPLQYAKADELAHVLVSSIDSRRVRVQADPRTNSLVLVGVASDIGQVKLLITKLDIPVK